MKTRKSWMSVVLIATLLLSLLPPLTAFAEARMVITSLTTGVVQPANISRFTSNTISITVTIESIADDELSQLYYEIENPNTGEIITETANRAVKTGNPFEVMFENVSLTEGLNKITIKFGQAGVISSTPGWAYYTPVTNIFDLKMNEEDFIDDETRLYPGKSPYTSLDIRGSAPNASEVEAYLLGQSSPITGFLNNDKQFSFIANNGNGSSDINFRPGDNQITFVARNGGNKYQTVRNFAYDNGSALAYTAKIKPSSGSTWTKLITEPKITSNTIDLSAYLKNNVYTNDGGVTYNVYYNNADVFINSTYATTYDFTTAVEDSALSKAGEYNVYSFAANNVVISPSPTSKFQDVQFIFHNGAPGNGNAVPADQKVTIPYSFVYEDPTAAYLDHVNQFIGLDSLNQPIEITLNSTSTVSISELPTTLKVYANANTKSITATAGGIALNCSDPDANGNGVTCDDPVPSGGINVFSLVLQGLPDSIMPLKITPSTDADLSNGDSGANPVGAMNFNLQVSASPYVIVTNIFDGITVKSSDQITCGGAKFPCIAGRLVNLPASEFANVEVYVNNKLFKLDGASIPDSNGVFELNDTASTGTLNGTHFIEGKNVIRFDLYLNGQLVSEKTFNVFIFSEDVPSFKYVVPVETNILDPRFIAGQTPDTYVTKEETVLLKGEINNYGNGGVITAVARRPDTAPTSLNIPQAPTFQMAAADALSLPLGTTIIDFTVTNNSKVTVNKSITIIRENLPYVIVTPKLVKNAKGIDQANLNANYAQIVIKALGADQVLFGKVEASINNTDQTFLYEATNLKSGENQIKFTVIRGKEKTNGSFIINNMNVPIEGAQYKTPLQSSKLKVFGGDVELSFPRGTNLMRNKRDADNQFITSERKLLFGIANNDTGKLAPNETIGSGQRYLSEPTGRFRPASKLYWIDAGTIDQNDAQNDTLLREALTGSGRSPYGGNYFYSRRFEDLVVPTQRGTLTLKYDTNIRDNAWKYVTVYQFDIFEDANGYVGPGWRNIGGVVNTKNNTITVPINRFGYFQVMYMDESFDDVTAHPWARDELDVLYTKGIMKNKVSTRFVPNDAITRGEFATMLVNIFEIPLENQDTAISMNAQNDGTFKDVLRGRDYQLYDFQHIEAAARAGIVRGAVGGFFRPGDSVSRQDAAVMIARAAELKTGTDDTKILPSLQKLFTDAKTIDIYARPAVEAITKAKLIEGIENVLLDGQKKATYRFDPLQPMTRAEAAVIALRVLKQQKKVP